VARSPGQKRVIVLIHGLCLHPFSKENVGRPLFRDWQEADSKLVKELHLHGDVFAYAYAQEQPVEHVVPGSALRRNIESLRDLGYEDIVLIGHSAGGLIARHFVEDNPESGVTRVIQICSPNGGSSWAKLKAVRRNQFPFMDSLTKDSRRKYLDNRKDVVIPEGVQFVCVVGNGAKVGDGVVALECQWTEDLQRQGIPALALDVTHISAMRSARSAEELGKLLTKDLKRWRAEEVERARKSILSD
jgi:pimeloyl-ACP methyl ester carboxylesterase